MCIYCIARGVVIFCVVKHDIDMRMNEWNRHALFFKLKRKKQVLALVLIEDLGFLPLVREIQRLSTRSATLNSWKDGISHTRGRNPRSSIGTRVRIYYSFHPVILTIFKDLQFSIDQKPCWPSWIWHKIVGHNFGRSNTSKFGPIWTLSFLKRG